MSFFFYSFIHLFIHNSFIPSIHSFIHLQFHSFIHNSFIPSSHSFKIHLFDRQTLCSLPRSQLGQGSRSAVLNLTCLHLPQRSSQN